MDYILQLFMKCLYSLILELNWTHLLQAINNRKIGRAERIQNSSQHLDEAEGM